MKNVILLFSLILNAIFLTNFALVFYRGEKSDQTYQVIQANRFSCPEGITEKIEKWGQNGYARSCVGLQHGKWEAWEKAYKNIEGEYTNGKKNGKWIWYHPSGKVYREVYYEQGVEVSSQIMNEKS